MPERSWCASFSRCASCHARIWSRANSSAARRSGSRRAERGLAIGRATPEVVRARQPSNCSVSSRTRGVASGADRVDDLERGVGDSGAGRIGPDELRPEVSGEAPDVGASEDVSGHANGSSYRRAFGGPPICYTRGRGSPNRPRRALEHRRPDRRPGRAGHRDGRAVTARRRTRRSRPSCTPPNGHCSVRAARSTAPRATWSR